MKTFGEIPKLLCLFVFAEFLADAMNIHVDQLRFSSGQKRPGM